MPDEVFRLPEQRGFQSTPLGAALGAFGESVYESLVPQSIEELGLELSPIGKAIGLIPPKYVQPLVKALKERVLNRPGMKYTNEIEQAIDKNPRVAAHLKDISLIEPDPGLQSGSIFSQPGGLYTSGMARIAPSARKTAQTSPIWNKTLDEIVAGKIDPRDVSHGLSEIKMHPELGEGYYGAMFPNLTPSRVLKHEFTHAAQDVSGRLSKLLEPNILNAPYKIRPHEIGARIGEQKLIDPQNFNYDDALLNELNKLTTTTRISDWNKVLPSINEVLGNRGKQLVPNPVPDFAEAYRQGFSLKSTPR